jgi:hypothetical protein
LFHQLLAKFGKHYYKNVLFSVIRFQLDDIPQPFYIKAFLAKSWQNQTLLGSTDERVYTTISVLGSRLPNMGFTYLYRIDYTDKSANDIESLALINDYVVDLITHRVNRRNNSGLILWDALFALEPSSCANSLLLISGFKTFP